MPDIIKVSGVEIAYDSIIGTQTTGVTIAGGTATDGAITITLQSSVASSSFIVTSASIERL
jgi:hypothetical protein